MSRITIPETVKITCDLCNREILDGRMELSGSYFTENKGGSKNPIQVSQLDICGTCIKENNLLRLTKTVYDVSD